MIRNNNKPHRQTEANQQRTQRVIETYHGKVDLLRTWEAQPAAVLIRNHADILRQRAKIRVLKNMILHRAGPDAEI